MERQKLIATADLIAKPKMGWARGKELSDPGSEARREAGKR